jgi:hypothetical protein
VCAERRAALDALLGQYPKDFEDRSKGNVTVADLALESPKREGTFGDPAAGSGYWGATDIDGDGVQDRVLRYESIDFWSYIFFVRRGGCLAFAGFIEAYQVQLVPLPGGLRNARALLYPTGPAQRIQAYRWTGTAFEKKAGSGFTR